jgi:hypoxanthine phosphoribosyltransferase
MDKLMVSWDDYITKIYQLIARVKESGKKYEFVWGPPRGGMIPAVIFGHQLDLKVLLTMPPVMPWSEYKSNLLIVDDCVDNGRALNTLRDYDIAVLYKKPWSPFIPKFFIEETDKWIVFPYEEKIL